MDFEASMKVSKAVIKHCLWWPSKQRQEKKKYWNSWLCGGCENDCFIHHTLGLQKMDMFESVCTL